MMIFNTAIIAAVRAHAASAAPNECCGLVVELDGAPQYWPCRNIAAVQTQDFVLDPLDYALAADAGPVLGVCHSHVYRSPQPSSADRAMCEQTGVPWLIVNYPVGSVHEFKPCGWQAPLIGRDYSIGVLDCYALVRDHYAELGVNLPEREPESFAAAGFDVVMTGTTAGLGCSGIREHDVIVMALRSPDENHLAVYLGANKILHHILFQQSRREVYGGWYRLCTRKVLRHQSRA